MSGCEVRPPAEAPCRTWRRVDTRRPGARTLSIVAILVGLVVPSHGTAQRPVGQGNGLLAERPNLVLILVDDLDYGLAARLYHLGHLPNLRSMAQQGTIFSGAYVTTGLCCPTRATLLTGQYSHNHGVLGNDLPDGGAALLADTNTLATWLADAGYRTGYVGKYLNGYGEKPAAPSDSALNPAYVPPYDFWRGLLTPHKFYNYGVSHDGTSVTYGTGAENYQTDVLAGLATEFVAQAETNDAQPFFLVVAPVAPHVEQGQFISGCTHAQWAQTTRPAPRHVGTLASLPVPRLPGFNEADVSDKPPTIMALPSMTPADAACAAKQYRNRAESMRAVDDLLGSVATALSANGEWDHTVVVFISDNGYYHGEHRLWQKLIPYEEGIRVPLVIRIPGAGAGITITKPVLSNDIAPTLAELAGVTPGLAVDGRSLLPLMANPTVPWRVRFLVEFLGTLVTTDAQHMSGVRTGATDPAAPNAFYNVWQDGSVEYYDLATDPYQLANNPGAAPPVLGQYLSALKTCGNGTCQGLED